MAIVSPSGGYGYGNLATEAATGRDPGQIRQTLGFGTQVTFFLYKSTKRSGTGSVSPVTGFRMAADLAPYNWPQIATEGIHRGMIYEWVTYVTTTNKGAVGIANTVGNPLRLYYRNKPLRSRGRNYRGPIGSGLQRGI